MKRAYVQWLIFLLVTPAQFFIAGFISLAFMFIANSFCPYQLAIDGDDSNCILFSPWAILFMSIGAALAAILTVTVGTLTCPIKIKHVPFIIYFIGAITTLIMVASLINGDIENKYVEIPGLSALISGLVSSIIMAERAKKNGI